MPDLSLGIDSGPAKAGMESFVQEATRGAKAARLVEEATERLSRSLGAAGRAHQDAAQKADQNIRAQALVAKVMRETGVSQAAATTAVRLFGREVGASESKVKGYAVQLDRAAREVQDVATAQREAVQGARAAARETLAAARAHAEASQKADRYTRTQRLIAQIMRETGVSVAAASRAVRVFGTDLDRAEKEGAQYARSMDRAEREVRELTAAQRAAAREAKASGSGMSFVQRSALAMTRTLLAAAAAGLGVHQAMRLIGESKDAALQLQAITRGLSASVGGGQAAAAEYAFLRGEVERLGLVLPSAAKDLTLLSAAAKGTELAGEPVRDLFSTLSGVAGVLSLSADDLSGAFVQLSQGISKGKFELEDLKSVFERIPGSAEAMARGLGVSRTEMFRMQTAGELLTKDAIPALVKGLQEVFGGQIAEGAQSDQAAINRLSTAVFEFKAEIGAGLMPALVAATKETTAWLAANRSVAREIGEFVGGALALLLKTLALVVENWELLAVALAAAKWQAVAAAVTAVTTAITTQTVALRAWLLSAGGIGVLLAGLGLAVNLAADAFSDRMVSAMVAASASSVDFRKRQDALTAAIQSGNRALIEAKITEYTVMATDAAAALATATLQADIARKKLLATEAGNETPGWLQAIFGASEATEDAREEFEKYTSARGAATATDREAQAALEALRKALASVGITEHGDRVAAATKKQKEFLAALSAAIAELEAEARATAALAGAQEHGTRAVADLADEIKIQQAVTAKVAEAQKAGVAQTAAFAAALGRYQTALRSTIEQERKLAGAETLARLKAAIATEEALIAVISAGPAAVDARRKALEREAEILEAVARATHSQAAQIEADMRRLFALQDQQKRSAIVAEIKKEIAELQRLTAARERGIAAYNKEQVALRQEAQFLADAAAGVNVLSVGYLALLGAREALARQSAATNYVESLRESNALLAAEVEIIERYGTSSRQTALEIEILRRQVEAGAVAFGKLGKVILDADLAKAIRDLTIDEENLLNRERIKARSEEVAADISGIIGGALRDLAENGEINFDRLWNTFADMGFQAIEAILQKWIAAQFAPKAASFVGPPAPGSTSSTGGLFGGAGAISGALGVVAIAAAVWAIGKAVVAHSEAKRFGTPTSFDFGTRTSGAVTSNFAANVDVWRALEDGVNAFRLAVGGFLADLPKMEIQIRGDGEKFRAAVAGVMLGTFDSAEEALEAALAAAFRSATWTSGVGEEMTRALGRISQVGLDKFAALAPIISEIDLVSEGASVSMARALIARRQELTAVELQAEQLIRLGVAYDKVIAWREREIRAMIEQERQGLLGLAGVSSNAAAIADALARIAALRRVLEEDRPPPEAHAGDTFFDRPVTGPPPGYSGGGGHGGTTGVGGGPGRGGTFDDDWEVTQQAMLAAGAAATAAADATADLTAGMRDADVVTQRWQDDVADLDDSMGDAQLAAAGLTDAFIAMALDIARMEDQGSALSALLAFQEQYGVQVADNDKLRDRIARIEFAIAKGRLQLTLLEMAANAALYNLTAAQVAQYQRWAAEIGALDFADVSRPRRQGRGPRPGDSDADREAADATRAAEQFADVLAELRSRLSGATDAARQYAAEQQRLRDLHEQSKLSAEDLNDALRIMAQLHLREIAADWAGSARAFAETDVGRAAREASQRARDALEAAMLAAVDAPDMYERVAAAIRDGLTAALHQIGRDAIGSLGSEFVNLRREGMATVRTIRYLMSHLEELGLTAGQVGRVVAQAVLPQLLDMAIAAAEAAGNEQRAEELRARQAKLTLELKLLELALLEAQLEAAGALSDEFKRIIAGIREDLGALGTDTEVPPSGPEPPRADVPGPLQARFPARPGAPGSAGPAVEEAAGQVADILRDLIYAAASPAEQARLDFDRLRESILAAAGSEEDRARALILAQEAYDRKRLEGLRDLQKELLGEAITARGGKQSFRAAQSAFEAAVATGDEQAIEDAARLFLESAGGFTEASSQQAAANLARQQILAAIGPMLATLGGGQALGAGPPSALLAAQISGPGTALPAPAPIIIQQGPGMEALRAEISGLRAEVRALQSPGSALARTAAATEQTALRVAPMRELADFIRRRP